MRAEEKQKFIKKLNSFNDKNQQDIFLSGLISPKEVERRRPSELDDKRRTPRKSSYLFEVLEENGVRTKVCLLFFFFLIFWCKFCKTFQLHAAGYYQNNLIKFLKITGVLCNIL